MDFETLNENFRKAVNKIKNRTAKDNQINEDYAYKYDNEPQLSDREYYGELYPIKKYIDSLNISSQDVLNQDKDYSLIRDINTGAFSFNPQNIDESASHLPQPGSVQEKNIMGSRAAIDYMRNLLKLSSWQFAYILTANNIHIHISFHPYITQEQFVAIISGKDENVKVFDEEMDKCGYYKTTVRKITIQGRLFIMNLYNPYHQDSITDFIRNNCQILYHCSPVINKQTIEENGFIPSSNSPAFKYPKRAFFNVNGYHWEEYISMMKDISMSHSKEPNYTNHYILYTISIDDIPDDVKFYSDINAIDCCYTNQVIPYDSVIKTKEIIL